ncbi:hypothetical protein [Endozoicomonas atrinae]|uniref:hypothetical protein n=1 Tax=Endozoicomonas atrinae TaxID=1333660 RepID=UPI0008261CEE|nr:hypothetical protein [Endozoicomonas atrinae]
MKIDTSLPIARHVKDLADKVEKLKGSFIAAEGDSQSSKAVKCINRLVRIVEYRKLAKDTNELGEYLAKNNGLAGLEKTGEYHAGNNNQEKSKPLPKRGIELILHFENMINQFKFPKAPGVPDDRLLPIQQAGDTGREHMADTPDGTPASRLSSTVSVSSEGSLSVSQDTLFLSPQDSQIVPSEQSSIEGIDGLVHEDPAPPVERTGPLIAHSTSSVDDVATDIDRAQRILKELNDKNAIILSPSQQVKVKNAGFKRDLRPVEADRVKLASLTSRLCMLKEEFEVQPYSRGTRKDLGILFDEINKFRPAISPRKSSDDPFQSMVEQMNARYNGMFSRMSTLETMAKGIPPELKQPYAELSGIRDKFNTTLFEDSDAGMNQSDEIMHKFREIDSQIDAWMEEYIHIDETISRFEAQYSK